MNEQAIDNLSKTLAGGLSRRQMLRLVGGGATAGALAVAGLSTVRPASAQATLDFPAVTSVFDGVFSVSEFAIQRGQVVALGTLSGTGVNPDSMEVLVDAVPLAVPFINGITGATCEILTLVLGPLHLELLGLVVDLSQVELEITGETGSLLGDLLCSIAGLLSGNGGALGRLRNLLNQIFGLLGL